jgi:hypothetical protein
MRRVMLMTKPERAKLEANGRTREENARPVVKLFTPDGNATWLVSELAEDGDTMFALCDLGMGSPELGYVSLAEIEALRGRFGLPVERDRHWTAEKSLVEYADEARAAGRIKA